MNVYLVTSFDRVEIYTHVAANSLMEALAVDPMATSARLLGELVFAGGNGEETAKALAGGRQLTEAEIKATITEDGQYLVSLENGEKYKSLRAHLKSFGLTPEQYRAKWGLPPQYPMNSVAYSMARRDMALAAGLGKGSKKK